MVRAVVWLVLVGCSQPAAPIERPKHDPDATPDVPDRWRYRWEERREAYKRVTNRFASPCEKQRPDASMPGFFYPAGPSDMAALVVGRETTAGQSTLYLDRGPADGVDENWSGALLDESGRRLHPWVCVTIGRSQRAAITIDLPLEDIGSYRHVALFQERPNE